MIRALRPQPVRGHEHLVDTAAHRPGVDRGELMDHHLGLRLGYGLSDGLRIQCVRHSRAGAHLAYPILLSGVRVMPTTS